MEGLAPAQNIWGVPRSKQLHTLKTAESMVFLLAMTAIAGELQPIQVKGEKPTVPDECEMANRIVRAVSESAMVEVSPVSQLLSGQTGVGKTAEQSLVPGSSTKLGPGDWPEMPSPWTGKPPPPGKAILFEPKAGISARQEENITIQGASGRQVQDGNNQPGVSDRSITKAFLEETLVDTRSGKQIKTSNFESAKPLFAGIAPPSGVEVKATGVRAPVEQPGSPIAVKVVQVNEFDNQSKKHLKSSNVENTAPPFDRLAIPTGAEAKSTGERIPVEQLGSRIAVEVVQAFVFDRQKTAKVQLKLEPEHLGKITIKLAAVNGEITARFFTESAQAKEAIESSLNQLRESLQPYRMHLGEASVSLGMEGDGQPGVSDRSITKAFLEETLFDNQSGEQIKTSNVERAKPLFAGIALPSGVKVKATGVRVPVEQPGYPIAVKVVQVNEFDNQSKKHLKTSNVENTAPPFDRLAIPTGVEAKSTGERIPVEQLGSRIAVEVVQAFVFDRQKTAKVQLKLEPEHLGKITIKLAAVNGEITARFYTESAQAKEAIESSLNQLRESLQPYRMHLGEASVSLGMEGDGRQGGRDGRFIPTDRDFQKNRKFENSVRGAGESEKPIEMGPWTVNYLV